MKPTIIILLVAIGGIFVFLAACKKRGPEADTVAAIARGEFQFVALLDADGKWTRPEVPGIPTWYFETTGVRIQQTKPETREKDIAYMKSYNDALTRTLKAQGKFHVIEENVTRVKANLEKQKQ